MQLIISGYTGKAIESKNIASHDGSGSFEIAESSLAVKNANDTPPDWYKLKFRGDRLLKAASYIAKGVLLSVVGNLTFEDWTDADGNRKSRPVLTVTEIQLPPKFEG